MVWATESIGELCEILDSKRKPITKKDRVEGPYPYYGATGILDHVEDYLFDEELVLIGEDGAKWGAGDNSAFSISGKTWVNNHAHVLRPNRDVLSDAWLIYYLNAQDLSSFISGMTVPKLNQGKLREIPVPIPPLIEQKRIVAILDQAFADIDKARALTEQNLKNAHKLFESYLQQIFSQRGEGWAEKTLSEVCHFENGDRGKNYPSRSNFVDDGIAFINAGHIDNGEVNFSKMNYITEENFELLSRGKIKTGDILFCLRGSLGKFAVIDREMRGAIASSLVIVRPHSDLSIEFLLHYLRSGLCKKMIEKYAGGAAQPNLGAKDLAKFSISVPPAEQQQLVSTKLNELIHEIEMLKSIYQKKLTSIGELKKSLLQKAFSGELTKDKKEAA